ncbi:hypothetical protein ACGF1Z_10960 [Streptomyces sp. NPDC048018]|uniref:hypothetical protein n=1 Tax=Streptomyces sp. NPDC048018 TaxID=3365499 RepID=UPI003712B070
MRPRNALALAALVTAATTTVPVVPDTAPAAQAAAPAQAPAPSCGAADAPAFPLATRIHDGPAEYPAGGGFRTWWLDLVNTTKEPCRDIHPVLVFTDRDRVLSPAQIRAEFYDADARIWRPVVFEGTDRAESVGVFSSGPTGPASSAGSASPASSPSSAGTTSPHRPTDPTSPPSPTGPTTPLSTISPAGPTSTAGVKDRLDPAPTPGLGIVPEATASSVPDFPGFAVPAGRTLTVPVRLAFRADTAPDEVVVNAAVVQRRGDDGDWVGESGDYRITIVPADPAAEPDPLPDPVGPSPHPSVPVRPTAPGTAPTPFFPELARTGQDTVLRHTATAAALLTTGVVLVLRYRGRRRRPA